MPYQGKRHSGNKLKFRYIIKHLCITPLKDSNISINTRHLLSQLLIYSKMLCKKVNIDKGVIALPMTEHLRVISLKYLDYRKFIGVPTPPSYPEVSHLDLYGICNQFPDELFPNLKSAGFYSGKTRELIGRSHMWPQWVDHVCVLETLISLGSLNNVSTEVDFIPSALFPGLGPVFEFNSARIDKGKKASTYGAVSWLWSGYVSDIVDDVNDFQYYVTKILSGTYNFLTDPDSISKFVLLTFLIYNGYFMYYDFTSEMTEAINNPVKYPSNLFPTYVIGKPETLAPSMSYVDQFGHMKLDKWIDTLITLSKVEYPEGASQFKWFSRLTSKEYTLDQAILYAKYYKDGKIIELDRITPLALGIFTSWFGMYAVKWIAGRLLRGAQRVWDVSIGAFRWTMSELSKDLGITPLEITDIIPSEMINLSNIKNITFTEQFDMNRINIRDVTGVLYTFYQVESTDLKSIKFESDNIDLSIYNCKKSNPFENIQSVLMTPRLFMTGELMHFTNVSEFTLQGTRVNPSVLARTNIEEKEKNILRKIERLTITRCTLGVNLTWADVMQMFPKVQTVALTGISTLNNIGKIEGVQSLTKIIITDSGPVTGEVLTAFRNVQNVDIISKTDIKNLENLKNLEKLKNLIVLENRNRDPNPSITLNSKSV